MTYERQFVDFDRIDAYNGRVMTGFPVRNGLGDFIKKVEEKTGRPVLGLLIDGWNIMVLVPDDEDGGLDNIDLEKQEGDAKDDCMEKGPKEA